MAFFWFIFIAYDIMNFTKLVAIVFYVYIKSRNKVFVDCFAFKIGHDELNKKSL